MQTCEVKNRNKKDEENRRKNEKVRKKVRHDKNEEVG